MDAGAIKAGQAYVEIATENGGLDRGLTEAQSRLKSFSSSLAAMKNAGLGLTAGAGVFAGIGAMAVKAASSAQELQSRFSALFKTNTAAAAAFATELASSIGRSRYELQDSMGTFAAFFSGLGVGGDEALKLSKRMTTLATDFASFHNLADSEGMQRFISALSGSSEVLDRFGINTKQAALQQELLAMGVSKSWTQVSELEKVFARMNVIARAMGSQGAIGDAARTAGSFANQAKSLQATIADLRVEIGRSVMTAVTPYIASVREAVKALGEWAAANGGSIVRVAQVTGAVGGLGLAMVATSTGISSSLVIAKAATAVWGRLSSALSFLRNTTLVAAKATDILAGSFHFVLANPYVAAFAAIAAAVAGIAIWSARASVHVAKLRDDSQELLAKGDTRRQEDSAKVGRLQELAGKGPLNQTEAAEAKSILRDLKTEYGDFGVTMDTFRGQVLAAADSFDRLAAAMKSSAAAQLAKAIDEAKANVRGVQEELANVMERTIAPGIGTMAKSLIPFYGTFDDPINEIDQKRAEAAREVSRKLDKAQAELASLMARERALTRGVSSAVTGASGGIGGPGGAGGPAGGNMADAASWERRILDLRIKTIADSYERDKAAIDAKYAYEVQKAQEAGAAREVLSRIGQAYELELADLNAKTWRDRQGEQIRHETELAAIRAGSIRDAYTREVALINTRADGERRLAEMAGDRIKTAQVEELRRAQLAQAKADRAGRGAEFDARVGDELKEAALAAAGLNGKQLDLARLQLERERLIAEANQAGGNVKQVERLFDLRRIALGMREAQSFVTGGFGGGNIESTWSGSISSGPQERQIRILEAIKRGIEKLNDDGLEPIRFFR